MNDSSPDGWTVVDGRLHREFTFSDFRQAFAFMTAVALEAERLDHHPDWSNSWNRVTIDIVSHSEGGITDRCRELAARINRHAG
ncbi:MAG TPA: 4a-hydroxytetrahydrobiopterin dehydratase [Acidimicrobiales bacterium]|nr:4a-hydroxytetrahydrobiopterin dehydratase [Acidimicrobiales bacterium]